MPKTPHQHPSNAIIVHYDDITVVPMSMRPRIQVYCERLVEEGKKGSLWVYDNRDKDYEYMPDVIYPSIVSAANDASCRYLQMGIHYGVTNKQIWGLPGNV